jgi:hypothetical protein
MYWNFVAIDGVIKNQIKVDTEKVGYGLYSSVSGWNLVIAFCEFRNEIFCD